MIGIERGRGGRQVVRGRRIVSHGHRGGVAGVAGGAGVGHRGDVGFRAGSGPAKLLLLLLLLVWW